MRNDMIRNGIIAFIGTIVFIVLIIKYGDFGNDNEIIPPVIDNRDSLKSEITRLDSIIYSLELKDSLLTDKIRKNDIEISKIKGSLRDRSDDGLDSVIFSGY
jgi:hypothetical protein